VAPQLVPERILFLDKELFPEGSRGEPREVDFLARVFEPEGTSLLVHLEIEVRYRATSVQRLKQYYHLLEARHGEPVFSILLALRGGPRGLVRLAETASVAGQRRLFEYTAVGVGGLAVPELLASPEPVAWALAALAHCRPFDKPARKLACLDRIAKSGLSEYETYLLVNVVETYLQLSPEQREVFETLKLRQEDRTVQKIEITWADRMREEGRRQGVEEGHSAGKAEGILYLLKHLLQQRFGELSAGTLAKVEQIRSVSRLTRLAEQTLSAHSLEEMGL
jgi:hypothetical protein